MTATIPLPTGVITFLFTDIEGSTGLWEHQPDLMELALTRHNAIIGEIARSHGGSVFKTMGDSFHAAFANPSHALAAAIDAQRALVSEAWDVNCAIRVRMAIHTGPATESNGDYVGQPLNQAARLLSVGYGGQVLLSLVSQQLVRGRLPSDTELRDLGEYQLRDLKHADHIFQVVAPGLPSDFPALAVPRPMRDLGDAAEGAPLLALFGLGDDEGNRQRVRDWMVAHTKLEQQEAIKAVLDVVRDNEESAAVQDAAFVLDYVAAVDLGLFSAPLIDDLSRHPHYSVRSVAASILWTGATIAPGSVPLDIVVRLVVADDDWYVATPAQRALQQLALSRADAMQVLIDLAGAAERDHRLFASEAFAAIAAIRPASVPLSALEKLAQESDFEISDNARRALTFMPRDGNAHWRQAFGTFSMF